jgi:predicted Zn-dependent protease
VRGVATFIEDGANTYRILAYATTAKFASYAPAFDSASSSFGRLTDPRALAAKPMRVKIEAVPAAMTLEEFNARSPSSIPLDELALINGLEKGSALVAGQLVKCVVQ